MNINIIFELANPDVYLETYTGTTHTTTTDLDLANEQSGTTQTAADAASDAIINILPGGDSFWGRKPKPKHP